jgi:hypothetical protein
LGENRSDIRRQQCTFQSQGYAGYSVFRFFGCDG